MKLNAALGVVRVELTAQRRRAGRARRAACANPASAVRPGSGAGHASAGPNRQPERLSDAACGRCSKQNRSLRRRLEPLRAFILPGGSAGGGAASPGPLRLPPCGAAARRAAAIEPVRGELLRYLNRLSDLLFVLARAVNQANRVPDVTWEQGQEQGAGRRFESLDSQNLSFDFTMSKLRRNLSGDRTEQPES